MGNFPLENISLICLSNVSVGGRAGGAWQGRWVGG